MNIFTHSTYADKAGIKKLTLLFLLSLLITMVIEAGSMLALYLLPITSKWGMVLIDVGWTIFIVLPLISYAVVRPLVLSLEGYKEHTKSVEKDRGELERRVSERTAELSIANQALAQEVAEKSLIEQVLREKDQHIEMMVRHLPAILWAVDTQLNLTWLQGASLSQLGVSHDDIVGKNISSFKVVSKDHPIYQAHMAALAGHSAVFEQKVSTKIFQLSVEPMYNPDGMIVGCVGLGYDMTEIRSARNQIQLQTTALQSDINAISITDRNGCITWVNEAFTCITGYPKEEVLGKDMRFLKSGQHGDGFYRYLWDTILNGNIWSGEIVNKRKDGSLYHEHQIITPVIDEQGQASHFISVKKDITPRKMAEEELTRRNQELELLNEIGTSISKLLEPELILKTVARFLAERVKVDAGLIFFHQEESQSLQLAARWGDLDIPTGISIPTSTYHNPQVLEEPGCDIFCSCKDKRWYEKYELDLHSGGWGSSMCILLQVHGHLIGVIEMLQKQVDTFKPEQRNFFQALGSQVSVAVQNAHLFKIEMRAREHAQLLRRAGMVFGSSIQSGEILNKLLEYLQALTHYEYAYITLMDGEEDFSIETERGGIEAYPTYLLPTRSVAPVEAQSSDANEIMEGLLISDLHSYLGIQECVPGSCVHSWIIVPLVASSQVIGYCLLGKKEVGEFNQEQLNLANSLVIQAAIAVQNAWLFEQVSTGRDRAKSLSQRLVSLQEAERRSLARELHDETSQSLASLLIGMQLIERSAHNPDVVIAEAEKLEAVIEDLMNDMHRIAIQLRPASLDQLGLIPSLRQHINAFQEKYNLPVNFESFGLHERFPPELEIVIFRIVQEALTNVIRHSKATQVDVLIKVIADELIVIVEDNGIGFHLGQVDQNKHLGLTGIQERVEMLGGNILIETAPEAGVMLKVEFPWNLRRETV